MFRCGTILSSPIKSIDETVGAQVPPPFKPVVEFNSTPASGMYFFLMTDENKLGVLLHELTHIKTLTDLEDKDEDVWRTGPFYQNFTIGKDPVGIWGKDLLKSLKKKLP